MSPDLRGGPEVAVAALLTIALVNKKEKQKCKEIKEKMETPRVPDVVEEEDTATEWLDTSLGGFFVKCFRMQVGVKFARGGCTQVHRTTPVASLESKEETLSSVGIGFCGWGGCGCG
jgi:hypothetical protein